MGFATLQDVRDTGNLPDSGKLPDTKLTKHYQAALRELVRWIGTYTGFTGDDKENAKEAECCLTLYYALPSLNIFFTEGASTLQKEVGDMEFQFMGQDDIKKAQKQWYERARRAVADYNYTTGKKPIGFNAI